MSNDRPITTLGYLAWRWLREGSSWPAVAVILISLWIDSIAT